MDEELYELYKGAMDSGMSHEQAMAAARGDFRANAESVLFTQGNPTQRAPEPYNFRSAGGRAADAARVAGQGLTFGLGDEFEGMARAAVPGGMGYTEGRDAARAGVERVREESPALAMGLEGVGGMVTGVGAGRMAAPMVKGMGRMGRALTTAAMGSAGAGAYGAAASDAPTLGGRARDAVPSAIIGGVAAPAMALVGGAGRAALRHPGRAAAVGGAGGAAVSTLDSEPGVRDMGEDVLKGAAAVAGLPQIVRRATTILPRVGRRMGGQMVREAAEADLGPDAAQVIAARQAAAGPQRAAQMRAMDLGENLRGVATTASGVQGSTARAALPELVEARATGRLAGPEGPAVTSRLGRLRGDVEDVYGERIGQSTATRGQAQATRDALADDLYPAARAGDDIAEAVDLPGGGTMTPDLDPRAAQILSGLDEGASRRFVNGAKKRWEEDNVARVMRGEARRPWNPRSVEAIQLISQEMGTAETQALARGAGNEARTLGNMRRELMEQLEPLAPELATANRAFAEGSRDIEAAYVGSGQAPPGQRRLPRFTTASYEDFTRDWKLADTPERVIAATRSIVDDIARAIDAPAAKGQELKLVGRYADGDQVKKAREVIGEENLNVLMGRESAEEAMSRSERALSNAANSKTATNISDINIFKNPREWATLAIQRVWPQLRVARPAAEEIGRLNQLSLDDFSRVLTEMQQMAEQQAQGRGIVPTAAAAVIGGQRNRQDAESRTDELLAQGLEIEEIRKILQDEGFISGPR